ncbi:MAG: phosphatidylserine decarboxylase [Defluviitaleaceae bacterium]|nr:phosphatidylserine decarboxylase [Defluviitaleaceae bacterium]
MNHEKNEIFVYNNGQYEKELIPAEKLLRLIYESPVGSATLPFLVKRKILSRIYGLYCRTAFSARKIPQFIEEHNIDMTGYSGSYKNFTDFFARERTDVSFPGESNILGSPCEGVASAYLDIDPQKLIGAKGSYFSLGELFNNEKLAETYRGGSMLHIRLKPANYHRLHFFDEGKVLDSKFINGDLFSVSPIALGRIAKLYCLNKRALILFESKNFGDVALVEVGATFVGSIVHCFESGESVSRGQQAGYFLPGGSLLIAFFKKGAFTPDKELIKQTTAGYETTVLLGKPLGYAGAP